VGGKNIRRSKSFSLLIRTFVFLFTSLHFLLVIEFPIFFIRWHQSEKTRGASSDLLDARMMSSWHLYQTSSTSYDSTSHHRIQPHRPEVRHFLEGWWPPAKDDSVVPFAFPFVRKHSIVWTQDPHKGRNMKTRAWSASLVPPSLGVNFPKSTNPSTERVLRLKFTPSVSLISSTSIVPKREKKK